MIRAVVDEGSFFEMKPLFGRAAATGLARIGGRTVGLIANNPMFRGGALDADACDKITKLIVTCDSFNIPLVLLVDTPGFAIGPAAEQKRAPGKIMTFMQALQLCTVPKLTVILRKSYGQAYLNMGGGQNSDEVLAWPSAEVSFMDPRFAVAIVDGMTPADDGYEVALGKMQQDTSVWDIAAMYAVQHVILPSETRSTLVRLLQIYCQRRRDGLGLHRIRAPGR